jgi:putative SOS response-associated peptidase YedK
MCLRFALFRLAQMDIDRIFAELRNNPYLPGFEEYEGSRPILTDRYNIGPSYLAPVIRTSTFNTLAMQDMKWGFIPSWAKKKPTITPGNAKAETVSAKPLFRLAWQHHRCLIPVKGFYEPKGPKTQKNRQWFYFQMRDAKPFFFGGLWSRWRTSPEDKGIFTFTLVTTTPNEIVGEIHERMPLILRPDDFAKWLSHDDASDLLKPYPADDMECWPVGDGAKRLRKSDGTVNDDPSMIEPISTNTVTKDSSKLFG